MYLHKKSENNEWENETFSMKEYFKSIENWKYSDNAVAFLCYECQGCIAIYRAGPWYISWPEVSSYCLIPNKRPSFMTHCQWRSQNSKSARKRDVNCQSCQQHILRVLYGLWLLFFHGLITPIFTYQYGVIYIKLNSGIVNWQIQVYFQSILGHYAI